MTESKVIELKSAVCAALEVIADQEKSGRKDTQALERALKSITGLWISPAFQTYREMYGRAALMAHRARTSDVNPIFEIFKTTLDYGNNLCLLVSKREFDSPKIFEYLAGLHTTASVMVEHEADIDEAIGKLDPSLLR